MYYNQGLNSGLQQEQGSDLFTLILLMMLISGDGFDDSLLFLILLMTMM